MPFIYERISADHWQPPTIGRSYFSANDLSGRSTAQGLFRFHDRASGEIAQEFVDGIWPELGIRAEVFAFDWRCRQFAVTNDLDPNYERTAGNGPTSVVILDPFDMGDYPLGLLSTFDQVLDNDAFPEILGQPLFEEWRQANEVESLELERCAGPTVPGFYGGSLGTDNLSYDFTEIYYSFVSQLWHATKNQPPGAPAPTLRLD